MRFDYFIGGSYKSQALTADQEDTINWYPEVLQSQGATAKTALYPTPGVKVLSRTLPGAGRGHFAMGGREFAVIGKKLYEVSQSGATTDVSFDVALAPVDLTLDVNPVTMCSNGDAGSELFITSGENGFIFDLTANTLTQIAAINGKASMGDYLDGRFLILDANTSTLYISALFDGTTWATGSDFAQRSLAPDPWRSMKVMGRYIRLFGEYTTEVWQDTGENFPFAPMPGTIIPYGITAPFSPVVIGSDLLWLGNNKGGKVSVLMDSGSTPEVVSTYPIEAQIAGYSGIANAVGDGYSDKGHSFYLLSFDQNNTTWAYDIETKQWAKRGTWIPNLNRFSSLRPRFYAFAFNQHRILDSGGGAVYRMDSDFTGDVDELAIRGRVRKSPAVMDENKRIFYRSFELDLEVGLGVSGLPSTTRDDVVWGDIVLATAHGNDLEKDPEAGNSWNSGGASTQLLTGTGFAEFTYEDPGSQMAFGLTTMPETGTDYTTIDFAWYIQTDGDVFISEDGSFTTTWPTDPVTTAGNNDVFRVAVTVGNSGNVVTYWKNGILIYTSLVQAVFPLFVDASIWTQKGKLNNAVIGTSLAQNQAVDPQVMLRLSNDGGKTWGPEQMRSAGKTGEFLKRVRWNRLGAARRRVFEISVSDPIPWRITGANVESSGTEKQ